MLFLPIYLQKCVCCSLHRAKKQTYTVHVYLQDEFIFKKKKKELPILNIIVKFIQNKNRSLPKNIRKPWNTLWHFDMHDCLTYMHVHVALKDILSYIRYKVIKTVTSKWWGFTFISLISFPGGFSSLYISWVPCFPLNRPFGLGFHSYNHQLGTWKYNACTCM